MERVEAATAAKTSFITHMSHEMRTPLSGIIGMLELVNREKLPEPELKDFTQTAEASARALLNIANDVLDLSKLEAGVLKLDEQEFKPREIVEESMRLLKIDAAKKGLSLNMNIKETVPKVLIGDKTRLGQILFNLLGNAIKFTEHGSVSVIIDGTVNPSQSDVFVLNGSVIDTGIGIKPEVLSRLFKPFSQGEESITRRFGGTGLGLFISNQLCEKMGGSITVSSEVGKGSVFSFKVNLHTDCPPTLKHSLGLKEPIMLPSSIHILAAEDNQINQKILSKHLQKLGCSSVTMVSNGLEAVEACQQKNYDIVLMDIEMPKMNGIDAMREIRKLPNKKDLPIVCVTAHALISERQGFLEAGMNGCLSKPYNQEELCAEILKCLPRQK